MRRMVFAILVLSLFVLPFAATGGAGEGATVRDYIVVATDEDSLPADLAGDVEDAGGELLLSIPEIGIAVVQSGDKGFAKAAAKIEGIRSVVGDPWFPAITPKTYRAGAEPADGGSAEDDPWFPYQWSLQAIQAPGAWDEGFEGEGVVVAVLDSGVSGSNPDLADNVLADQGRSFAVGSDGNLEDWDPTDEYDPDDPMTDWNHGTHVAGIIAALDNDIGVVGVAPKAKILPVQVLSRSTGYGQMDWLVQGLMYAADEGADVINMSLAAYMKKSGYTDPYDGITYSASEVAEMKVIVGRALSYAHNRGCVIVAALANDAIDLDKDTNWIVSPAQQQHCIAVSATGPLGWLDDPDTDLDVPAVYTNYGKSAVSVAAPGGNVDLSFPDNWWADLVVNLGVSGDWFWFAAGTSMASPHVAGVAALILSKDPDLNPTEVWQVMSKAADDLGKPGQDPYFGHGRVNAHESVK